MIKEKFSLLRKTNPAKVVEGVLVKVYPYKKQIMDELEGLEKKRSKLRDIRKTEVYFQDNF